MIKPRVVIVLNSAEQRGGVERQVGDIINCLKDSFDFTVCCKLGQMVEEYKSSGANYINLYPRADFDPFYILKLTKLLKTLNPIAIHAHELKAGFNAMLSAYLAKVNNRIYHVHTPITNWQLPSWKKATIFKLNLLANKIAGNFLATKVIALTNSIKEERVNNEKIKPDKIVIIPNAVSFPQNFKKENSNKLRAIIGIPENAFVIGNISRLSEEKGHSILISAFSKLPKARFTYLVIAGDGRLKQDLEHLCVNCGVKDRVKFIGKFEDLQKYEILNSFDLFVFPSLAEGFGLVLTEAMLAKIPVIASDLPVFKDVAGDTVIYFKTGDINSLVNTINNWKQDKEIVQMAEDLVKTSYSFEKFKKNYKNLYLGLV